MIAVQPYAAGAARPAPLPVRVGLTAKQLQVLRYVAGYMEAHGIAPTLREIAQGVGYAGLGRVHQALLALEERGYLRRLIYRARAMELLTEVSISRAPDGAPCHFIPAAAIVERLEQLRPRGAA